MSLLDWSWFARPMVAGLPVTRASVKRLEAKTLREEAQSMAAG